MSIFKIKKGFYLLNFNNTALLLAISQLKKEENESNEIVNILLSRKGIDYNLQNSDKISALMKAVMQSNLNVYRTLSEKEGIDFNLQNSNGKTILHLAVYIKNEELINEIVNNEKVDVNIRDDDSKTPLHLAIEHENACLVNSLLKNKAININLQDDEGMTPLMIAFRKIGDSGIYYRRSYGSEGKDDNEKIVLLLINDKRIDIGKKDENISNNFFLFMEF